MPELLLLLAGVAMAAARVCRPQQTSQVSFSRPIDSGKRSHSAPSWATVSDRDG